MQASIQASIHASHQNRFGNRVGFKKRRKRFKRQQWLFSEFTQAHNLCRLRNLARHPLNTGLTIEPISCPVCLGVEWKYMVRIATDSVAQRASVLFQLLVYRIALLWKGPVCEVLGIFL